MTLLTDMVSVSYTHLDVYKRQPVMRSTARMLFPSASMEITETFFSVASLFAITC